MHPLASAQEGTTTLTLRGLSRFCTQSRVRSWSPTRQTPLRLYGLSRLIRGGLTALKHRVFSPYTLSMSVPFSCSIQTCIEVWEIFCYFPPSCLLLFYQKAVAFRLSLDPATPNLSAEPTTKFLNSVTKSMFLCGQVFTQRFQVLSSNILRRSLLVFLGVRHP